jgi:DNA-binding response OmpR family regulator
MPESPLSFLEAKQQLEHEMSDRQRRLISILIGQHRSGTSAAEKEVLENEIQDRKIAIEKLDAHCCCDYCEAQADVRETFLVHLTKYSETLPATNLMIEKVCIRAECSDCRRKYDSQERSGRTVATRDEIVRAFEMLRPMEVQRLKKCACWRVRGLGRASLGRTGEDLFHEALVSTFSGAKRWYKDRVNFFGYLRFAIRNTAFRWKQKFKECEPSLEADIIACNTEGDDGSPLEKVASSDPPADQCLSAKEQVERIFRRFENDKEVTAVLQARRDGMTTARAIMHKQNLTKRQYEGAQRRIGSQKSALIIEEDDQVLGLFLRWLKAMDFAVVTASVADDALRSYTECGPFDVVILSYSDRLNGIKIATDIRKKNPSQRIILTTTYSSEEDVSLLPELNDIPILLKPFRKCQLHTLIQSFANTAKKKPANCFRPRRRRRTSVRTASPLVVLRTSSLTKQEGTLNATPTS